MIPEFNPEAGLVPNCMAVLVQILHCAESSRLINENRISKENMKIDFFMMVQR